MNLLFICNYGQNRSRTGAEVFAGQGYQTRYAGIYNSNRPVTGELLAWTDKIFVFEQEQVNYIQTHWPDPEKRIFNLDISSRYCYGNPALGRLIREKAGAWL
ncbi:MAG: hypothetical protein KKH41_04720 [Candidatus Thermoplasmatota archaeon]|nr:hypothetical protein [Euryarchaeota archaeon]MBU4032361.1 hypothetical protein [Candidatus Thermoplasmatota archaeon]MBU4071866.1 hypothetical protein [Candidatus Thermoplasmatota archaeon]MBU4144015.1 hypothetical protein [Candidatus Thermoplasmatota archaeon]MBU4591871.1 hypothetical protein [Candidatus Thermoplasmatota archaeon]